MHFCWMTWSFRGPCVADAGVSRLQARHDEEAAALAKRRANFQRDRDQLAKEAEAEYDDACERAAFKLQVLLLCGNRVWSRRLSLQWGWSTPLTTSGLLMLQLEGTRTWSV